jgi:transposase InsO family protein
VAGLLDRSSTPKRIPHRTPAERVECIRSLRRLRLTAAEIAELLGMALSTVSLWLKRIGLGKRSRLEPPEPANRYERGRPGELVHVDIKKLGRILKPGHRVTGRRKQQSRRVDGVLRGVAGWEHVHVMVDDHSRLAYVEVLDDDYATSAVDFLKRGVAWFAAQGVEIKAVMTDNGPCYRAHLHAAVCRQLALKHPRIQPGRPRTNGKACVLAWGCRPVGRRGSPAPRRFDSGKRHVKQGCSGGSVMAQPGCFDLRSIRRLSGLRAGRRS